MTPEKLRNMALKSGAELVIDGKSFNASRRTMTVVPPPPSQIAEQTLTKEQVRVLLDERDAAWAKKLDQIRQFSSPQARPVAWLFKTAYDADGRVTTIRATPETKE